MRKWKEKLKENHYSLDSIEKQQKRNKTKDSIKKEII